MGVITGSVSHPRYRDDPVFPATTHGESDLNRSPSWDANTRFFNNGTTYASIGCIDHTQVCDSYVNRCWFLRWNTGPRPFLRKRNWDGPSVNNDTALVLLEACLADSSISSTPSVHSGLPRGPNSISLEAASHCSAFECDDLPDDQWKVEVRRWFEASLAKIQLHLLEIVRPSATSQAQLTTNQTELWQGIPEEYRAICKMGKFKSTGWRNVSFVGFFGLLALAGAIALASCESEQGDLWVVIALRLVWSCWRMCFSSLHAAALAAASVAARLASETYAARLKHTCRSTPRLQGGFAHTNTLPNSSGTDR